MHRPSSILVRYMLGAILLAACANESKSDTELARGGAGESCTRRADCADGLLCIAETCAVTPDAGTPLPSGEGGDCRARSDCQTGLVCTAHRCEPAMAGVDPSNRYGGRGESCTAKNDCEGELACVSNICREVTLSLSHTAKDCYRVECAESADCCTSFVPNENCDAYRENCETDPIFCNTYRSLCECSQECFDEMCVTVAPGCTVDAECTSAQTPFCVDLHCRQCDVDSSCPGAGTQCVEGVCMAACAIDENCPLLHACQDSVCVDVGCASDRECVFATGDTLAVCIAGDCNVPCDDDTDCVAEAARFQVCENQQCVFVGCENDAECRALFDLQSTAGSAHAACR